LMRNCYIKSLEGCPLRKDSLPRVAGLFKQESQTNTQTSQTKHTL
jgi:hypothetical protein